MFTQSSGLVPKNRASRKGRVRRHCPLALAIAPIRVAGTLSAIASALTDIRAA